MSNKIINRTVGVLALLSTFGGGLLLTGRSGEAPAQQAIAPEPTVTIGQPIGETTVVATTSAPLVVEVAGDGVLDLDAEEIAAEAESPATTVAVSAAPVTTPKPTPTIMPVPTTIKAPQWSVDEPFPDELPVQITGATTDRKVVYEMKQDSCDLLSGGVAWDMTMTPSENPLDDYHRIMEAVNASGLTVTHNDYRYRIEKDPTWDMAPSTYMEGKWRGKKWTLNITQRRWLSFDIYNCLFTR